MTTTQVKPGPPNARYPTADAVLIGHTDAETAGALAHALHQLGLTSVLAFDTDQAHAHLDDQGPYQFTVVLLDTRLVHSGLDDLVHTARRHTRAAVMTLGSEEPTQPDQDAVVDAHLGLDTPVESIAALTCTLAHRWHRHERQALRRGPLRLDPATREARAGTRELKLTSAQFRILAMLTTANGAIVTTTSIAHALYGTSHPTDTSRIRAHIVRLRQQLRNANPEAAALLVTIRAEGYRLTHPRTPLSPLSD